MQPKSLLLFTLVIAGMFFLYAETTHTDKNDEQSKTPEQHEFFDLGMTIEEFKSAYESKIPSNESLLLSLANARSDTRIFFEEKVQNTKLPLCSLNNANLTATDDFYAFKFNCADVEMKIYPNKATGKINKIEVATKPFSHTTNAEKTFLLIIQSTVFSIALEVFDPKMNEQEYRESMIKRFYSNFDVNYLLTDTLRCKATKKENVVTLMARHKDLKD